MQKNVIIALAVIGALTAGYFVFRRQPTKPDVVPTGLKAVYNQWKVDYKINVGAAEDDYRFKVFSANYQEITQHNMLLGKTYKLGLNSFTHLTQEEFDATYLSSIPRKNSTRSFAPFQANPASLKTTVDWRVKLNAIKNQGQCGSCWAFSAVGAIEAAHSVFKGNLYYLSEQELVDCSGSFGNLGCSGGYEDQGIQYAIKKGGLATNKDYPYTATDGTCKTSSFQRFGQVSKVIAITPNSPDALKAALNQQPTTVAVQANLWKSYTSGILNDPKCGTNLNHAVVAVGYDTEGSTPYYIVRNSWGASWGETGHIRIAIQAGKGVCGIQMEPFYPVV
jgi:C1A family cysteine protease